ncbi:hypothetical protein ASD06_08640 [Angustibacter sp. Root456]|nr:hypothetical protein ASD06_08640 [Angustibacter sp. Root456]
MGEAVVEGLAVGLAVVRRAAVGAPLQALTARPTTTAPARTLAAKRVRAALTPRGYVALSAPPPRP